jgi:hypothetical protein
MSEFKIKQPGKPKHILMFKRLRLFVSWVEKSFVRIPKELSLLILSILMKLKMNMNMLF